MSHLRAELQFNFSFAKKIERAKVQCSTRI